MIRSKNVSTLVFIDSNVEDYQSLISGVSPNAEVIILDETRNGIEQITERLAIEQNIEAITSSLTVVQVHYNSVQIHSTAAT